MAELSATCIGPPKKEVAVYHGAWGLLWLEHTVPDGLE